MTPLQTPPPVSSTLTTQAAPPALKQPNQWIMNEPDDQSVDSIPSVSFPLLTVAPQARAAAPSHVANRALSTPTLQPQSFEFLKFPSLNRDTTDNNPTLTAPLPHPIPIRPSECFRGRSPSLQHIIDNELNHNLSSESQGRPQRVPGNAGAETPSHLARRGPEERIYLQNQWRAEESLRRKQQWENEQRCQQILSDHEYTIGAPTDEISALMEKFNDFELNEPPLQPWIPMRVGGNRHTAAPSPPVILQKSFKRSVSAVIADSRGQEDGDACVLFFPDGFPLVDECNDGMSRRNSHTSLDNCHSFEMDSKCTLSPHIHDVTAGSTPFGTISCHSSPNSIDYQPVLMEGEADGAASSIFRGNNKKVMLRPKMKVRPKTPAKVTQTDGGEGLTVPDQIDCNPGLLDKTSFSSMPHPDENQLNEDGEEHSHEAAEIKVNSLHSINPFPRLDSEATIVCNNGSTLDQLPYSNHFDCYHQSAIETSNHTPNEQGWNYSSPDPICRSNFRPHVSSPHEGDQDTTPIEPLQLDLKEPLSESNYCTPDQSNPIIRKQLVMKPSGVLDTLPELLLPSLNKKPQGSTVE